MSNNGIVYCAASFRLHSGAYGSSLPERFFSKPGTRTQPAAALATGSANTQSPSLVTSVITELAPVPNPFTKSLTASVPGTPPEGSLVSMERALWISVSRYEAPAFQAQAREGLEHRLELGPPDLGIDVLVDRGPRDDLGDLEVLVVIEEPGQVGRSRGCRTGCSSRPPRRSRSAPGRRSARTGARSPPAPGC